MATSDSHPEFGVYVPNVTLAVARPAPGGDITGLTVTTLDGSIAHGNRIRIEAEASYAIGPKAQAAPKHWQMGSDIYLDGVASTAETVGGSPDTVNIWEDAGANAVVSNSYLRHARVDNNYLIKHAGELFGSRPFSAISSSDGAKYYQAFRAYPGHKYNKTRIYTVSGVTGTFAVDANLRRGEQITIDTSTATNQANISRVTGQAYLINLSNGYLTYEQIDDMGNDTELAGSTITGSTSDATATLAAYKTTPASVKAFRVKQENVKRPGVRITYSYLSDGQFFIISRDGTGTQVNAPDPSYINEYIPGPDPDSQPMQWHLVELIVDFSGDSGKVYLYTDGLLRYSKEDYPLDYVSTVNGTRVSNVGLDTPATGGVPIADVGMMMSIGEWYMDNDTRRIYICDAATVAGSTSVELLRPEAWTENADGSVVIDAYLYQGEFADLTGKYLALVNNATVIFEGVAL